LLHVLGFSQTKLLNNLMVSKEILTLCITLQEKNIIILNQKSQTRSKKIHFFQVII
jgi:hypothetical protein